MGGASGAAGKPTVTPTSCTPPAPTCGTADFGECCAVVDIPGGTFTRGYGWDEWTAYAGPSPGTIVSPYRMDVYEISVGRFRRFVEAYPGSLPKPGQGAHPKYPETGWKASTPMPTTQEELRKKLTTEGCIVARTWSDQPGPNDSMPINCVLWEEMAAFCIWDGGRLPTEAEWEFAAAGGDEQRFYPWSVPSSSKDITFDHASFEPWNGTSNGIRPVGSFSKGKSRWGQADLSGNAAEWTLDLFAALVEPCVDCIQTDTSWPYHQSRGGGFVSKPQGLQTNQRGETVGTMFPRSFEGGRCVR